VWRQDDCQNPAHGSVLRFVSVKGNAISQVRLLEPTIVSRTGTRSPVVLVASRGESKIHFHFRL
jgi:hypothetical protein